MYQNQNRLVLEEEQGQLEARSAAYITRVMGWMCLGLFTTLVSAIVCLAVPSIFYFVNATAGGIITVCILQLGLVIVLSAAARKLSPAVATVLFLLYSAVTGLTLSVFAVIYTMSSLLLAFGVTAVIFLAMAVYGALTQKDLSRMGSLLMFGLLGIILAGLVNMFLRNTMFDFIITCVGVVVFIGLTAYDTQKIKAIYQSASVSGYDDESDAIRKLSILGALTLYLDFINLFIRLVSLLGKRRNN